MKRLLTFPIVCVIVLGSAHFDCLAWAEVRQSFTTTSPEKLADLNQLHEEAERLIVENKFREAINIYSEILLTEPDDEVAYTNTGHAYMVLGDFGRAKDAFQNALHINPENQTALLGLQKIADPDSALYGNLAS